MEFKFAGVLCALIAMAAIVLGNPTEPNAGVDAERAVGRSSQLFAAKVYKELKNEQGNLLICPVSVQTVLALVQAGAKADTSTEIQRTLSLPEDKSETQLGYRNLMQSLLNSKKVTMDIANRVYVKDGYQIKNEFKDIAVKSFAAGIENINFNDNVGSAQHINNWVEQTTHNKIRNLIPADSIDSLTRMILVNALYFKGNWKTKFDEYATRKDDFFLNEKDSVQVPMMSVTDQFNYAVNADLDCKFLELPYDGNEFAMTIVLPNNRNGLAALESRIDEVLKPQNYNSERVHVKMPTFTIESTIKFNEILKKLGMSKSFTGEADFSGLLESKEGLFISDVIQKNFINVTEAGTEAASATAVEFTSRMGFAPAKEEFKVDHPFMFTIQQRGSAAVIFIGRVKSWRDPNIVRLYATNSGISRQNFEVFAILFVARFIHYVF